MLESYITPLVLSYVDKYVKNLKPSDLQLSFWGGDAVLKNLELRLDVLEKELGYPLEFRSGRVQELTIHIPWTALGSEPVEVQLNNVELVLKLKDVRVHSWNKPRPSRDETATFADGDRAPVGASNPADQQQTPGYLAGLLDRIVNNVVVRVRNVVIKVVEDECDLTLSVSLKAFDLYTADEGWRRKYVYTDSYPGAYSLFRVCEVNDVTVCLDQTGGSGQVDVFEEPFVSRCSFAVRMETKFVEGLKVKQTTHVHCSELRFSVTEDQFSLFLRLMDWLLAMYYSSKKLKGRDDQCPGSGSGSGMQQEGVPLRGPKPLGEEAPADTPKGAAPRGTRDGGNDGVPNSGQSKGWGAWMWSLLDVEDPGEGGVGSSAVDGPPRRVSSSSHLAGVSSAFGVYVDSIKVTFVTTLRPRQPTFFIVPNLPSRAAFSVCFSGCMARVEKEPSVQRFLVSVGIVGVASSVHGLCVCSKKKARGGNWMGDLDAGQGCEVKVFALGREEPQTQAFLHGSLFGLPYKQSARWEDAFPAVSFSYDYYDRGGPPAPRVEQCTEALRVGSVAMVLGPDVVHRVHHFVSAFSKSLGTRPLLSQGMVVIGDPVAETTFNISVSQILLCVTSNSHFVSLPAAPKLPGNQIPPPPTDALCLRLGTLCSNIIMPMYGGNATEDISQRFHACVELCSAEIKLCTHFNPLVHFVTLSSASSSSSTTTGIHGAPDRCVSVPSATITYHSQVTGGAKPVTPACLGLSLKVAEVTASLSQLALVFDLASLVEGGTNHCCSRPQGGTSSPVPCTDEQGGQSDPEGGGAGELGQTSQQQGNLVEGFLSIPVESQREKMFPVLQLSISGFGVSLEPAFLDYIRALPLHLLTVPPTGRATEDAHTLEVFPSMTSAASSTPLATPLSVIEQAQEHSDWLSVVRIVVVKIKVSQSLIMITQNTQFQEAGVAAPPNTFPGLARHQLHSSPNQQAPPAVVMVLPSIQLESTRGHILDQPVLKGALLDTLPWECRASSLALLILRDGGAQFVLEPTNGEVAMATTGSVHQGVMFQVMVPSLVLNLSKSEAGLLKAAAESLIHTFSHTVSLHREGEEEGEGTEEQEDLAPGSHSFPAPPLSVVSSISSTPSVHTTATHQAPPESVATSTSSDLFLCPPSWSLWVGLTLPKLSVNLRFASNHAYTPDHTHTAVSKLSADMEGVTFCVDVQGRATIPTIITQLKVTSAECYYLCSEDNSIWRPLLAGAKVFSSTGSVLPKPCATAVSTSLPSLHVSSRDSGGSSSFVPIFIQAEFKAAASEGGRLSVNIQPFEVVLWLPLVEEVKHVVMALVPEVHTKIDCVRIVAPDPSYTSVLFFDVELLRVTSAPDNPVNRLVVNHGAYKRLVHATEEGGGWRGCLPAYQLDITSVSLWGMRADKPDGAKGFIVVTSFSVRSLLAPPLYYKVPSVDSEAGVLACGCSVEVNIDTDTSLVVGMEQVTCLCNILSTNYLQKEAPVLTEPASLGVEPVAMERRPIPLQVLVIAKALSVVVLSLEPAAPMPSSSGTSIVPMLQATLLNSVLTVTLNQNGVSGQLSCFNAAINCSLKPTALDLVFLQDPQVMLQALPTCLLQTRKGCAPDGDTLPPSFLVLEWHGRAPQQQPSTSAVSVAIKRPGKLYLVLPFVKQLLALCVAMNSVVQSLIPPFGAHHPTVQGTSKGSTLEHSTTLFTFSTTQVLIELWLPPPDAASGNVLSLQSTLCEDKALARDTKEGALVAWNQCNFTYSGLSCKVESFSVDGLLLSQLLEGHVIPLVLPMQWVISMAHHPPTSSLDLPCTRISAKCDLVHVQLSQRGVSLLSKIASAAGEVISPFRQARPGSGDSLGVSRESVLVVHSTDDLKTSPFKFITSAMDVPAPLPPGPHEVVFHLGSPGELAGMSWCYGEPRVITRLKVSPVPFCVTTAVKVPVDLKVECQLQAWDEVSSSYITMCRFPITETSESIVDVTPGGIGRQEGGGIGRQEGGGIGRQEGGGIGRQGEEHSRLVSYRRWRICMCAFQWTEVEEGEIFINNVDLSDEAGSQEVGPQIPISSILSPLSLVACVMVESYFDPSLMDTCVVSLHCREAELRLVHMGVREEVSSFLRYTIVDMPMMQDLMRCGVHQIKADVRFCGNANFAIEEVVPSYAISLATDLATVRFSQGLVHSLTATSEVMKGVACAGVMVFSHYLICNDTLEEIHLGQASTEEDIPLLRGCCVGYSWRTHTGASQLLRACLVGDGRWRWTRPFSIDALGTQVVQLYVGRYLANLFVHISSLGGLQKKVTFSGSWRLFSELPFDLEVQVACSEPSYSQSLLNGGRFKLCCGHGESSVCSVLAANEQVSGLQFRIDPDSGWSPGPDPKWSPPYPIASSWSKPPFLVEVTAGKSFPHISLWYSTKLVEVPGTKAAWSEVTIAPLFAISNSFPCDLLMWSSCSPSGADQSEHSVPGRGTVTPLVDFQDSKWYHLRFGMRGTKAVSDCPALSVATFLIDHLPMTAQSASTCTWPFSDSCDGSQKVGGVVTTLPLATGYHGNHKVMAVLTRSSSNCIMVDLKPECLVVNHCPQPILLITRGSPVQKEGCTTFQVVAGQTEAMPEKEFSLKMQCRNDHWVTSKPIVVPTRTDEPRGGTKGRGRHVGELAVLLNWHGGMAVVVLAPSTVVVNRCKELLHIWPCELDAEVDSDDTGSSRLDVAPEESAAIMIWHKIGKGTTRVVRVKSAGHSDRWSIPISLSFVRRSFALPVGTENQSTVHCVLSRHQHEHVTYIVVSVAQSPQLLVQNLSSMPLEVVEAGIQAYDPPSLAVTYPVIQEKVPLVQPCFSLQLRRCHEHTKPPSPWSQALSVSGGKPLERLVSVPGEDHDGFLLSTHQRGDTIYFTVVPTGEMASPLCSSSPPHSEASILLSLNLSQTILCLEDEASDPNTLAEIIRIVADRLHLQYSGNLTEGKALDVTLASVQVDNMLEHGSEDFAVVLLPRSDHVRPLSLTEVTQPPLLRFSAHYGPHSYCFLDLLTLSLQPITVQIDNDLIRKITEMAGSYGTPGGLWERATATDARHAQHSSSSVPKCVIVEAQRDSAPLVIREMVIEPISLYFSAKLSVWVYLSCDSTLFHFPQYRLWWVYSNWTELVHLLGSSYMSSLLSHMGSLVGSLDLLGSPGTFAMNVGSGFRDLFTLPYEGITRSPALFMWGVGKGTSAFLHHLSAGALKSLVNFSSSVSHNMDRLSLDPNHISYLEQSRRSHPPSHFVSGVTGGVSSFGLSLISAVGGLVEHPLQGVYAAGEGSSGLEVARGVLAGMGKGLLGVVTKPVGGAMELVSQTGKGLMLGTGLVENVCRRCLPQGNHAGTLQHTEASNMRSISKCAQKVLKVNPFVVLLCCPATCISGGGADAVERLPSTVCTVEEKPPPLIDSSVPKCSELWVQATSGTETGVEVQGLHTVQDYLRLSSLSPPLLPQPATDLKDLTAIGSPIAVLQLESHQSTQLMSLLWSLLKHHTHPDMVFPVQHM
eukprot:Em0021g683a